MKKLISLVFPIYNEEETLNELYRQLTNSITKIQDKYNFELLFVNDGSRDKSKETLITLSSKDNRICIINFSRNFGHQAAITAGIDFAKGDAVITMDGDLQDPPEVILKLIRKWEEGYKTIYAKRKNRDDSYFKIYTAKFYYRLLRKLTSINIPEDTGDFRLMDRNVVDMIKRFEERNRYLRGIVSFVGLGETTVEYTRDKRYAGKTKYPLRKMIRLALDGIFSFSIIPLNLISIFGLVVSGISFAGILYALFMRIFFPEITVTGWTLLIISVLFIGGVQIIMLGILGAYIGRIYAEVQRRPLYVVEKDNRKP